MSEELEGLENRMVKLEQELSNLRQGYIIVNKRYEKSLISLRKLTDFASESAQHAAELLNTPGWQQIRL